MRWLIRSLLFWAMSAPLFYVYGLPYALDLLSKKAQTQGYAQCDTHLRSEGMVGSANAPLRIEQGEKYCHCVSDGLIFTRNDLTDAIRKKPPAALNALAQTLADGCNHQLEEMMGTSPTTPKETPPSDTDVIHL